MTRHGEQEPWQPARFGAEVWKERFRREWSLWDLWYCIVIELDHDDDPDGLREVFIDTTRSPGYGSGRDGEAKLNHLDDLIQRLAEVNRRDLPGPDDFADTRVVKRARDQVAGRVPIGMARRDRTDAQHAPNPVRSRGPFRLGRLPV
jgi:hypothetical protein